MDQTETTIGSEEKYKGKMVTVRVDTVRQPDGREAQREIVARNNSVAIVPIMEDGTILMARQFRVPAGKALLEVPAGTVEEGEDPEACAGRELEEETGYKAKTLRPLFSMYVSPGYATEMIYAYAATGLEQTQTNLDEGENVEIERLSGAEVERMIFSGEIQDGKTIAAVLAALHKKE